jgi:thiol:disulfide interchange protein DsbC
MRKLYFVVLMAAAAVASAAEPAKSADPRVEIAKKFPDAKPEDVFPTPIKGIYELRLRGDVAYVTADAKYLITGDLFDIDSRTNLTEEGRTETRKKLLAKLDEREMIVFGPQAPKHTITVFTDVECGYCRKLHSEIEQINKLGVRVRYLAYPRSGPGTRDWEKMEAVWCSKDRRTAITQAKQGREVKAEKCATPVAKQYELGGEMGTPAIFTMSGDYIGGYLPPEMLLQELEDLAKAAKN